MAAARVWNSLNDFILTWNHGLTLYGMSTFHFYRWNQFKVIPLARAVRARTVAPPPKKKNLPHPYHTTSRMPHNAERRK